MSVTEQLFVNTQPKDLAQLTSRVASATGRPVTAFRDGWSFELPDAVLVMTDINQRASISGAVPMLVMRP